MNFDDDILSFLDLLDLDEEVIDTRLQSLMGRSDHTNKQLKNALVLLQYKQLINIQENTECENEKECDFIVTLLKNINEENVDCICKIINTTLLLHTSSVVSKSEHLLQQILYDITLGDIFTNEPHKHNLKALIYLKVCNTILDAVIKNGKISSFIFTDIPIENILNNYDEKVKTHFLSQTVPKLFEGITDFNILDRIWEYIIQLQDKEKSLKMLSSLSMYYLPSVDSQDTQLESKIVLKRVFWEIILNGLKSNDSSIRKISIYLAKRAIDFLKSLRKNVTIIYENNCIIFMWIYENAKALKSAWDNFFVLIESLEEKQSNIVIPSLQLFEVLKDFGNHWLEAAFKIGLRHDNTQVRMKCIEHRLKLLPTNESEVKQLLDALNDINLFDNPQECGNLQDKICEAFKDKYRFLIFLQTIPTIKWSPIPFYYITDILAKVNIDLLEIVGEKCIAVTIKELMKIPCNNLYIRKAVQINITYFIGNCCKGLNWRTYTEICSLFKFELYGKDVIENNPFIIMINMFNLEYEEKIDLFHFVTECHNNIDFGLFYLNSHVDDTLIFVNIINEKLKNLQSIISRQYYDKLEVFKDLVFLMHLLTKTDSKETELTITLNKLIVKEYKIILQYMLSLLINEKALNMDDMALLFKNLKLDLVDVSDDVAELLCQLYQTSILVLKDKSGDLEKKVLSISNVNYFLIDNIDKHLKVSANIIEIFNLQTVINFTKYFNKQQNLESTGRLKNVFYEQTCKLVYKIVKRKCLVNTKDIICFIEEVLDCGGYGCLKWILKIINEIVCILLTNEKVKFNLGVFLNRIWKELEELKSNNQYTPCIQEFINLLTQDALLQNPDYNNLVILHCSKIIELAPIRNTPLCFFIMQLNNKDHLPSHLVYIICEILLFSPLPRKDQRIIDNVEMEIFNNPKYGQDKTRTGISHDFHIQYSAVFTLCKINDSETLQTIITFMISKIDEIFKSKNRYHGNSQPHRTLLRAMQHLLMVVLKVGVQDDKVLKWCIELLGKLPHQPSVRICLEWYIALYFYLQKIAITEVIFQDFKSKNIPLQSQFMVMYYLMKHKLLDGNYTNKEYNLIMDFFLNHTMGQMFNIRLHAQYLATVLYKLNKINASKYAYTIEIIERTFTESCKDKNFLKLQNDYYVNDFDIIGNLTPYFIYEILPKYDIKLDIVKDSNFIKCVMKDIDGILKVATDSDFKKEWLIQRIPDDELETLEFSYIKESKGNEDIDSVGTIQKKYIPWKNMTDVNLHDEIGKKRVVTSDLIVVATLVDKLPNLGGMARTSEVFGVKTYVVDSLRHLQDKQFQGLSVSAERWIDIEEVRPGEPLKEYLMRKKSEGYIVVAAEQTSTSCSLQKFKFPRKTLLLLGHEKEGVPCDLLPIMDNCVEIPQRGFVRSLNVHVTAAIFIWEYARQNIL